MFEKIKKFFTGISKLYVDYFHKTPGGRTVLRMGKTFFWSGVASYVALKTGPFAVDWVLVLETAILAALGFGADKGAREFGIVGTETKKPVKKTRKTKK